MYDWIMYPFSKNVVEVDATCQKEPWEERYHKESGISIVVATKISINFIVLCRVLFCVLEWIQVPKYLKLNWASLGHTKQKWKEYRSKISKIIWK